jgi:dTDP-glucose pyrophosphorylase
MRTIEESRKGIAVVVDEEGHLIGTLTDGDIRRALLMGLALSEPVQTLLDCKQAGPYPTPITAPAGTSREGLIELMAANSVQQLPLLDEQNRVVDLVRLRDLVIGTTTPLQAVIMAGGYGRRMAELTTNLPKPMLPIGDSPLLELIIKQLRNTGIHRVNLATHFQPEKITDYFGNGERLDVKINYVREDEPLGTAGVLSLMPTPDEPLLVINGDILTNVDFESMFSYHQEHQADLTVAVRKYEMQVPYGIIENDEWRVSGLQEKPLFEFLVNAGIYLLSPSAFAFVPSGQHFDMTDLIQILIKAGKTVACFPVHEYWLDIGRPADYSKAQQDVKDGKLN